MPPTVKLIHEVIERYGKVPEINDVARRATCLIADYWAAVRKLAIALLRNSKLDRAEVKRLLDPLR